MAAGVWARDAGQGHGKATSPTTRLPLTQEDTQWMDTNKEHLVR